MLKKIARILLWVLAIILFLIGTSFLLFQMESVQTWAAKRMAAYLSDQLKTKVGIGSVSIKFVEKVSLKNFYIEDQHHNTLLYADELLINIKDLSTKKHELELSLVKLDHARFFLTRYKGDDHDNIRFLSDYFSSKDTTSSSSAPWKIRLTDIRLEDVAFRHIAEDETQDPFGVDFTHLDVSHIFGDLENISFVNDSIFVNINKLRFTDRSGFRLDEFSADAKISPTEMRLRQFVVRTPYTDLHTDLTFSYDSMSAFDNFINAVSFNSDFRNSTVSFHDIAYFAHDLQGNEASVKLDGNFKGTVNRFKGKNAMIGFGEKSYFKGTISMNGLPKIEDTWMDVQASELQCNKKDVESIPLPPFNEHGHVEIPENLASLGNVTVNGKFTGLFRDFTAFGNVTSDIGLITANLNVKLDREKKKSSYNGHVSTNHFDLGKILSADDLGALTMSADIEGSGFRLDNVDSRLVGTIEAIEFKKYTYRGIKVNGEVAKKLFSGSLTIHEPDIDLDFAGTVNFQNTYPQFDFTANIGKAELDTLNFFNAHGQQELKTQIVSHFTGNKLNNINGSLELLNTDYRFDKTVYHVNSARIDAATVNGNQSVQVTSDNVDASLTGRFELASLGKAFKQILPQYLPAVSIPEKAKVADQDFSFDIRLKNVSVFTENFLPSWWVEPNTSVKGKFNSADNTFNLDISSSLIKFKNFQFTDFTLNALADREQMKLRLDAARLYYADSSFVIHPQLKAEATENKVSFGIEMGDTISTADKANLKGSLNFSSASRFDLHFEPSVIGFEGDQWQISSANRIVFDTSVTSITGLTLSNRNEQLSIAGNLSKNEKDLLTVGFSYFELKHLNTVLKTSLGGTLNGSATVADVYRKLKLSSDLSVDKLQFNGDTLGNATFITAYDDDRKVISVDAGIQNGAVKIVSITGDYYTTREKNSLDAQVKLNNFYLNTIGKYVENVISELNGRVSADLKLSGTISKPVFTGTLNLNRVRCKVNYLNTRYNFTNDIVIGENYFELKDFKIYDERSESAIANGRITHNYFKNFNFDVKLEAEKFQCLNTLAYQNSLYYGVANASGSAYFSGPLDEMNMQIQFKSERGSQIYIPLSSSSEVSQSNFITIREKGKFPGFNSYTNKIDLSGIRLDMSLDITPDAEIQIIFDEKIGDKITGTGNGNLRLEINSNADFNMYGQYEITSGSYLFTLQNIINKRFSIERGGTISWNGSPYDADISLSAVYTTKTSTLYKLIRDSSYRTSLPVECRIYLSNKLMNPTIKYSIDVKGVDAGLESQIRSVLNSEGEASKQMFGLLVLGQFLPPSGTTASNGGRIDAGAGASANAVELLSDQVSNWLSQLSPDLNIGVNYKAQDTYSKEEVQVMLSKSFADDRLLVEGNFGYINAASTDQTNSNFVGDFTTEYKISDDGRFRIKAFNRSNTNNLVYNYAPYTQGFGVFYREEFNTFRELLQRYKLLKKAEEEPKAGSN